MIKAKSNAFLQFSILFLVFSLASPGSAADGQTRCPIFSKHEALKIKGIEKLRLHFPKRETFALLQLTIDEKSKYANESYLVQLAPFIYQCYPLKKERMVFVGYAKGSENIGLYMIDLAKMQITLIKDLNKRAAVASNGAHFSPYLVFTVNSEYPSFLGSLYAFNLTSLDLMTIEELPKTRVEMQEITGNAFRLKIQEVEWKDDGPVLSTLRVLDAHGGRPIEIKKTVIYNYVYSGKKFSKINQN